MSFPYLDNAKKYERYITCLGEFTIITITDSEGVYIYGSDLFFATSKYSVEEIVGTRHELFNSELNNTISVKDIWDTISQGNVWRGELSNVAKDGSIYWTNTVIYPGFDEDGKIAEYCFISNDITKAKLAEQQLADAEEKYENLFNLSPIPMWVYDAETCAFINVNEAAIRNYGYSREDFSGMTIRDIRPVEDLPKLEHALKKIREKVFGYSSGHYRHKKKNGEIIYVKLESNIVYIKGKKAVVILAIDTSSELLAQQELHLANTRLKTAQEISKLGYWSNDLVSGVIHWSDELYQIFEQNPDTFDLTFPNIVNSFHPEDRVYLYAALDTQYQNSDINETKSRIITGTGKIKWIHQKIRLIKDIDNKPLRIEGVTQDITEAYEKERLLWESNERLKLVMYASQEAIIDWDIEHDVTVWGDGFHELFGYDLTVYDNFLWSANIHPDDRDKVLAELDATLKDPDNNIFNAEFRYLKANREPVYVRHRGIFIRDDNGKPLRAIGSMIDISGIVERTQKIEKQNATLNEIAWIQSHLVRAPLATLMGLVDLLRQKDEMNLDETELIDHMQISANKLDDIIRTIVRKSESVLHGKE